MAHVLHLDHLNHAQPRPKLPGLLAELRQAFADLRAYRAVADELGAFSDADLADIGLSRHNIRDVAHQAAYGA